MKLFPHAQQRRSANPKRVSSLGGHVRSLVASAGIHLALVLSFVTAEPAGGLAPGVRAPRAVAVNVRGLLRRPSVFGATQVESARAVESAFVEPSSYELVEASAEWNFEGEFSEVVEPDSTVETRDLFATLPTTMRFVEPIAVELQEFTDLLAAVERSEPEEPAPTAVVEEPELATESGSSDEVLATIIVGLPPAYPKLAVRMGWEGSAVCFIEIDANGQVLSAIIKESSGYEALDAAALKAIRGWKFQAGSVEGRAARTTIEHTIHFELTK